MERIVNDDGNTGRRRMVRRDYRVNINRWIKETTSNADTKVVKKYNINTNNKRDRGMI